MWLGRRGLDLEAERGRSGFAGVALFFGIIFIMRGPAVSSLQLLGRRCASDRRGLSGILATASLTAAIACALPDNAYQRWQLLDGTIHRNCAGIYERCHFDPTPIDVAFIGPSRTAEGVNAPDCPPRSPRKACRTR